MDITKYLVKQHEKLELSQYPTSEETRYSDEELRDRLIPEVVEKLQKLHLKMHAEEEKGIVVVLQAMDAAGKDEAITFIFSKLCKVVCMVIGTKFSKSFQASL